MKAATVKLHFKLSGHSVTLNLQHLPRVGEAFADPSTGDLTTVIFIVHYLTENNDQIIEIVLR